MPDSSDCQRSKDDSKTSIEKTAPDIAPTAAPRTNPLSVSCPIKAPVIAPNKVPTAEEKPTPISLQLLSPYPKKHNSKGTGNQPKYQDLHRFKLIL